MQTQPMRVGLVEHPPWVIRVNDEPRGAEVELVRQFASVRDTGALSRAIVQPTEQNPLGASHLTGHV